MYIRRQRSYIYSVLLLSFCLFSSGVDGALYYIVFKRRPSSTAVYGKRETVRVVNCIGFFLYSSSFFFFFFFFGSATVGWFSFASLLATFPIYFFLPSCWPASISLSPPGPLLRRVFCFKAIFFFFLLLLLYAKSIFLCMCATNPSFFFGLCCAFRRADLILSHHINVD